MRWERAGDEDCQLTFYELELELWFSPDSEVPMYRQLVTQVVLHGSEQRPPFADRHRQHPLNLLAGSRASPSARQVSTFVHEDA